MARRKKTEFLGVEKGKSPFAPGSRAADIDYAITNKVRSMYSKLFGMQFEPLANEKKKSGTKQPQTQQSGAQQVAAFNQAATASHVKNMSKDIGEIKGILSEMSKTLKEVKSAIEEGGGGGILESITNALRGLLPGGGGRGGSTPAPSSGGRRNTSAGSDVSNSFAPSSASDFAEGMNQFLNPAVDELEGIREKLESENTIAVKFSKTSDSAKQLREISENTSNIPDMLKNIDGSPDQPTSMSTVPPGWKHDPNTGAMYKDKYGSIEQPTQPPKGALGVKPEVPSSQPTPAAQPVVPTPNPQPAQMEQPKTPIQQVPTETPAEPTDRAQRVGGRRGRDHIGYGHRLTDEELRTGKIKLPDGTEIDANKGISKEDAEKLYQSDRSKLDDLTRRTLKNKGIDLDSLPSHIQDVMKDMGFNGPAVFNKNPKIIEGLKKGQSTGDYGDLAETVRGSMHTADGKVLGGLVKRANDRADAILDPSKKIETKKFEGLETELYDPLVPKNKRTRELPTTSAANAGSSLTQQQAESLTKLDKAIQESISRYGGEGSKPYVPTTGLLEPLKPSSDRKYTSEEQELGIKRFEDALKSIPTAQLDPTQRQTGPVLGSMETQLASARDEQQSSGGAPTIINNTTNNTTAGSGGVQGPVASVRNEENSIVRMQNLIAMGALS